MRILTLLTTFAVACNSSSSSANLAVLQELAVDPGASCMPWYTAQGEHAVHSTMCWTSEHDTVYCRVDVEQKKLEPCQVIVPGPATLARAAEAQRAQAATTPTTPATPTKAAPLTP